jgi:DNA-binding NarL/FixJ family response regulator
MATYSVKLRIQKDLKSAITSAQTRAGEFRVSFVRGLVVDDFARFRGFVRSMLGKHPDFQVVGEASDGLEAVHIVASQESSAEVVQEALRSGALGYVTKARLFTDLIPAIHEAMLGHTFVSGSLQV